VWRAIVAILVTLMLLRFARAASGLLGMLAISFFFSLAMDPAVRSLHRRRGWRRGAAVGVIYAVGIGFIVFMVAVLIPSIGTLADQISTNFDDWVANLRQWSDATFGFPVPDADVAQAGSGTGETIGGFVDDPLGAVLGFASAGAGLVFNVATIAMFTFYFTADAPKIQRAVLRLCPPRLQQRIGWTWDQAIVQTGGYFYSRLLLMAINAVGFFITMAFVGMPLGFAMALAVFGGFVSVFIPAVGTYIGGAVPILLTLAFQGLVAALIVLAYVLVYQQIENYWLSPKISADTMSLNGGVAFGAAMAGGAIGGAMGAFVALPIAALITSSISNYRRGYEVVYTSSLDDQDEVATDRDDEADGSGDLDRGSGEATNPAT
jgi:predicted PurR-regulated permease PerM